MGRELTPRQRVEIALRGGHADRVPFTIYEAKIPQCEVERRLRNRGMCIVKRDVPVYRVRRPHVKVTEDHYYEDGRKLVRTWYETPAGTLSTLHEPVGFTSWTHERMFKSPDDYKALRAFLADEVYEPCYESFAAAQDAFGEDAIFRSNFGLEPLQCLISGNLIGMERFCLEWMDRRDELLALYRIIVEQRRRLYPIVAQSPVLHANYGGNVVAEVIGRQTFQEYYLPHYQEAAEAMHRHGKLIGCHYDANCRLLAPDIARAGLDYIEAFTPAPDTDMTLAEARAAWPNQVLWINYSSSMHLQPDERVTAFTHELLDQAGTPDGLIMGITEDIPEHRWRQSCTAIMDGLEQHAARHPERYG